MRYGFLMAGAALIVCGCSQEATRATALNYGTTNGAGSAGVHTVLDGDTVYSISKAYKLPTRDIITLNEISPPYKLMVGYRVKLPAPREYRVHPGDTLSGIARTFDTTTGEIARLNNIRAPYTVRTGQVLRMPTPTTKEDYRARTEPAVMRAPAPAVERESLPPANTASAPRVPAKA